MSEVAQNHLEHLNTRPFAFRCATDVFPLDELQALREHGNWLEALAAGSVQPVSAEQLHFLAVDREQAEPETVCERAWVRLKGRREFEREQEVAPPPEQAEDYGIIEWDKERCWW